MLWTSDRAHLRVRLDELASQALVLSLERLALELQVVQELRHAVALELVELVLGELVRAQELGLLELLLAKALAQRLVLLLLALDLGVELRDLRSSRRRATRARVSALPRLASLSVASCGSIPASRTRGCARRLLPLVLRARAPVRSTVASSERSDTQYSTDKLT